MRPDQRWQLWVASSSHFGRYSSANTNARPGTRRGAFFVAGVAWVLRAHPEKVMAIATLETFWTTAMRGGSRQLHRTGERTATVGMGHEGMPAAAADLPAGTPAPSAGARA